MNHHLSTEGLEVSNLSSDLSDGLMLYHLLVILTQEEFKPMNFKPKMRIHNIENANSDLAFMKKKHVKFFNVSAEGIFNLVHCTESSVHFSNV
jgi:hypothetical protein